jgi:hypothetical protein
MSDALFIFFSVLWSFPFLSNLKSPLNIQANLGHFLNLCKNK